MPWPRIILNIVFIVVALAAARCVGGNGGLAADDFGVPSSSPEPVESAGSAACGDDYTIISDPLDVDPNGTLQ
jgi:hypothetical protein